MRRAILACTTVAVTVTAAAAGPSGALARHGHPKAHGFKTEQPAMLAAVKAGVKITPLLTVGDVLKRTATGSRPSRTASPSAAGGHGRVDLYVNHETAKVPFPYVTDRADRGQRENDFDNAQLSRLTLDRHTAGVLSGSLAITAPPGTSASARTSSPRRSRGSSGTSSSPTRRRRTG